MTLSAPSSFAVDAMLCDSAVTAEGKLYLQGGGWNLITPQAFPAQVARIGLAVVVTVPYNATNQNHTLRIGLQHEDGEPVPFGPMEPGPDGEIRRATSIDAQFVMGRPPVLQPGDPQLMPFALNLDGMEFTKAGAYVFVIEIDDEERRRLSFRVLGAAPGPFGPS